MDEKTTVSLTLILRHGHNAGNIVFLLAQLLLGKVADEVTSFTVIDGQYIEKKGLDVVIERLVVEEELGQ